MAAVVALAGTFSAIVPRQVAASVPTTSASTADRASAGADVVVVRHRTNIELVRNGGFHRGSAYWRTRGASRPSLRIVRRGLHSTRAARITASAPGNAVLQERLSGGSTHVGDRYHATAMVLPTGSGATVSLTLVERNAGRMVGRQVRRVAVSSRHRWHRLDLRYVARSNGSTLWVRVAGDPLRPRSGFVIDNVSTVQTLRVSTKRKPASGGSGLPTSPTPSPTATPTGTPTPTPTATTTPTPTPTATSTSSTCKLSAILVPSCGVLWGAYKHPASGENWTTSVTNLESQVGRKFNIIYRYHDFSGSGSGAFPDSYEKTLSDSGHLIMDDWQTVIYSTHQNLTWADVAAGKYDSTVIDPEALRIKAFGKRIFLAFDHEMDAMTSTSGTAAEYVAAYRHIYNEFAQLGVTNVIWVWTVTGYGARDSIISTFYPGNSYVDWIGYDPYNFASCHHTAWKTFNQTIDPFYKWLESNGYGSKPFMLPEYGTVPDPSDPSAAANWYLQIPGVMATHPNIKAMLTWDDSSGSCNTMLTASPGELAAFATAGHAPSLQTS
jgi:hypothetical protein